MDDSGPVVGAAAPDFAFPGPNGRTTRLTELRGSPVVLAFASPNWDPASASYIDAYNRLVTRAPGLAGARLLSIGAGAGPWRDLTFDDMALTVPVVADDSERDPAVAAAYGAALAPAVFVLDADGVVRWRHVADGSELPAPDELARALAALAAGEDAATSATPTVAPGVAPSVTPGATGAGWTRRDFVASALGVAFALALGPAITRAEGIAQRGAVGVSPGAPSAEPPSVRPVTLHVNGRDVTLDLDSRVTLLDALREYAGLTGSKKGCDHGQCGACTVHVDGRRVLSCLTLAVMAQGRQVTTIEGLATAPTAGAEQATLHPMQQAFIEHDGFQCGYCTPGQIMSACAVLKEPWGPSDDDVREAMSGNICRCGAYPGIVAAVQQVRRTQTAAGSAS